MRRIFAALWVVLLVACSTTTTTTGVTKPAPAPAPAPAATAAAPAPSTPGKLAVAPDTPQRVAQFPRTAVDYDHALLNENERAVVAKLIEASRLIDEIFWRQVSEDNPALRAEVQKQANDSPLDRAGYEYFLINKGPWDRLKEDEPFIGTRPKPPGAAFYPPDMTKDEFEKYVAAHPNQKNELEGLYTVVRRDGANLTAIPYSTFYKDFLNPAAARLREAAALATNESLRGYLNKRADAFLSDNYRESDIAWMDVTGPIEAVIGPEEVYEDGLFNYKAAFEAFVTVVDRPESERLAAYGRALPDMERNLPEPEQYKNLSRGTESPIRVVQELYTGGDARRGVQTAAFNLPNDEYVREKKGSKKVLLKNVINAKYVKAGEPIAHRVLDESQMSLLSFDAFFNQILFHELSHGLGPGYVTLPGGQKVEIQKRLQNLYSTIEESKADVLGLWNVVYAQQHHLLTSFNEQQLYATYAGLMFRGMRFGIGEAHGRGTALQWNWLREKGGVVESGNGRYKVDFEKFREGVKSLATELLTIEATGDFDRAKALLDKYGVVTPEMTATNAKLADIPVDINPVYPAAGER